LVSLLEGESALALAGVVAALEREMADKKTEGEDMKREEA
jgi:hypothetical protein